MKKITHLLALLLMLLSLQIYAQYEDFESTAVGSIPNTWTRYQSENDDPGFEVQDQTGYAYEGTHYLVHEGIDITTESTSWVVSNSIHVGTAYELKFAWRGRWANVYNYSGVYISTGSNDPVANPGDFTELKEFSPTDYPNTWLQWNEETFNLGSSTYANQDVYIAFKYIGDHAHDFFIDKVEVAPMPFCESPQNLTISTNRGYDYLDVNWTAVAGATEYEVVWGAPGFDPANNPPNTTTVTTNSAHITGLTQETSYDFYVRTVCSSFNYSTWTGPVTGTTAGPPPANDDCANAINLNVYDFGTSGGHETDANTLNATDSGMHSACDNTGVNLDLWYTFTVPAGEYRVMVITGGAEGANIEAAIYDSCGGTEIACEGQSNSKIFSGLTAGQTYTLQVWHDQFYAGEFNIAIEKVPAAPSNDNCANALNLTVFDAGASAGNETPGDTSFANDSNVHPSCDIAGENLDLWYTFTVPAGENTVFVLTGGQTGNEIEAALYDSCGGTEIDCKGNGSIKQFLGLTAGQTYTLQVWHDDYNKGPFNIALEKNPPPPACGDTFYDNGGANGDYTADMTYSVTLMPDTAGDLVTVTFNSFDMEQGFDGVMIYDGVDTNAPIFDSGSTYNRPACPNGAWTGAAGDNYSADGESFTATNADGALTLIFTSDGTIQHAGWEAVVSCSPPPSCPTPTYLSVSNILDTQADLSWTQLGSANTWNIEYGANGFTQGNGTMITGVTNNPYTLTGLSPSMTYDFYVQADCGSGVTSNWAGPYTFATACGIVTNFPYSYGFEDLPSNEGGDWNNSCWTADPQNTGADAFSAPFRWTVTDGVTPSSSTGPFGAHTGTQYAYTEASGSNAGDQALLISPIFDMSSLTTPQVTFYYHMFGADMGSLSLDTYDGTTWTNDVWTISGQQQAAGADPWLSTSIVIPQNTTQIRFRGIRGTDYKSDMAVDDITIEEAPSCPMPTGLSASNILPDQAELNWTPGANETIWNIEYGTTGFTQGNGTVVNGVTANPYTLTGLSSETSYDFYVQADCGSGDTSTWAGPFTFVTPISCPAPSGLTVANIQADQADLSWTPGGTETMWNIEYGPAGFTQGSGTVVNSVSNNPYTLTGLSSGTYYDFYVQADCGSGDTSTWVGPYSFSTIPVCGDTFYDDGGPNGNYSTNINLTYTIYPVNTGDMVTVTFNSFDMEEGYDSVMIYDGVDTSAPIFNSGSTFGWPTCPNGAWTGVPGDTFSADGQSFTATNTDGALTLVFKSDSSVQHAGWEATVSCSPSALTDQQIDGLKFYPNPVNNTLNITAGKNIETVRVYSVTGQEVINTKPESSQTQIDMSHLKNGVYFIKVQVNNKLSAFKIVKK